MHENGEEFNSQSLLPHRTSVSKRIETLLKFSNDNVINKITKIMKTNGCALTMDFSTDKQDFFVITAHYVDDSWY